MHAMQGPDVGDACKGATLVGPKAVLKSSSERRTAASV